MSIYPNQSLIYHRGDNIEYGHIVAVDRIVIGRRTVCEFHAVTRERERIRKRSLRTTGAKRFARRAPRAEIDSLMISRPSLQEGGGRGEIREHGTAFNRAFSPTATNPFTSTAFRVRGLGHAYRCPVRSDQSTRPRQNRLRPQFDPSVRPCDIYIYITVCTCFVSFLSDRSNVSAVRKRQPRLNVPRHSRVIIRIIPKRQNLKQFRASVGPFNRYNIKPERSDIELPDSFPHADL